MQPTELVCLIITAVDLEIPSRMSQQDMCIQYLKKMKLFLKTCQFLWQMWLAAKWKNALDPGRGLYLSSSFLSLW